MFGLNVLKKQKNWTFSTVFDIILRLNLIDIHATLLVTIGSSIPWVKEGISKTFIGAKSPKQRFRKLRLKEKLCLFKANKVYLNLKKCKCNSVNANFLLCRYVIGRRMDVSRLCDSWCARGSAQSISFVTPPHSGCHVELGRAVVSVPIKAFL